MSKRQHYVGLTISIVVVVIFGLGYIFCVQRGFGWLMLLSLLVMFVGYDRVEYFFDSIRYRSWEIDRKKKVDHGDKV